MEVAGRLPDRKQETEKYVVYRFRGWSAASLKQRDRHHAAEISTLHIALKQFCFEDETVIVTRFLCEVF